MNPVPVMELVEIIRGIATDDETYGKPWKSSPRWAKLMRGGRFSGFIVNRILLPMINEAVYAFTKVSAMSRASTRPCVGRQSPYGPV